MTRLSLLTSRSRGFSLMELLVAMGLSMILLAALSSIFAQSISTREKIDLEGQKIETARYSLDTLAEDVRLAGYYGSLAPGLPGTGLVNGATSANYIYVDPCSTTNNALPGWATVDGSSNARITIPMPIFGYEAHGTGSLPTSLTDCLSYYKTGTDVLVLRRASTTSVTPGGTGYTASDPYLQVSSCPDGGVDTQPTQPPAFLARATATSTEFNLHNLGCSSAAPGANASVRKLIYRIYYISQCDDCVNNLDNDSTTQGDGIPTLKLVELGVNGGSLSVLANVRTVAAQVTDLHIEYGIDTSGDGSIDAWVTSNEDPRRAAVSAGAADGTLVTGMRCHRFNPADDSELTTCDAMTENRWEDVMAIKLFLITRDSKPTAGYTDTKTFIVGSKTISPSATTYRKRLMSSTVKLVNMAGRREVP